MQQTVLITGANRGIGLALVKQLRTRGAHVIAVSRTPSQELAALQREAEAAGAGATLRVERDVDVTHPEALQALSKRLGALKLNWLVCNAGVLTQESLEHFDEEAIRKQFEVNALGPLRTVVALRGHLRQGSKVLLTTSRMGSVADNTSGGMYGYRMSKAALNMAGASLAHDLKPSGVAVVLLHPGFVKTDMTRGAGQITADEAARGLIARMDELTLEQTGAFLHQNGEPLPW